MKSIAISIISLCLLFSGCTTDDDPLKEPIITDPDVSEYPDDDGFKESKNNSESNSYENRAVGKITDDPFDDSDKRSADSLNDSTPKDEVDVPDTDDPYASAFEQNPGFASKPLKAKNIKIRGGARKVPRFVTAARLNIRSAPNRRAKVVGVLKKNDRIIIDVIRGGFARIEKGKWVRSTHLRK